MKRLIVILIAFSLLLVSSHAFASVYGTWNVESTWKSTLKQGKAKPVIVTENMSDVWIFQDDNSLKSNYFLGTWTQKAKSASFTVTIENDVMSLFFQNKLASNNLTVNVTIKKLRIFGSEKNIYGSGKKDWTIKGKYEIKADLVFPDTSTGTLDIKGDFTGTLPFNTSEYFPLNLGDTWTMREIQREITQEGEETDENIDTETVFGTEKSKGVMAMQRGDVETGSYGLMTNTSGLMIYKQYDTDYEEDVLVNETFDTFNPPLMYLPPKLSVGTRGTFKSTMTHKDSSGFKATAKVTVDMVVEGIEDVAVPAGAFQDCLKIKINRSLIANKVSHEELSEGTYWFAKGVGIVKRQETSIQKNNNVVEENEISTAELLSATVGGVNYSSSSILQVGNEWIYTSFVQGQYRHDGIIGAETIGETLTYILERTEPPPDNYHEKQWLTDDGSSVLLYRYWTNQGIPSPGIDFSPPIIVNKRSPQVGEKWSFGILNATVNCEVLSINETVSVLAGTFTNCLRIMQTVSPSGKITIQDYAPGVGRIRIENPGNWVEELVYAKVGANTYGVIP